MQKNIKNVLIIIVLILLIIILMTVICIKFNEKYKQKQEINVKEEQVKFLYAFNNSNLCSNSPSFNIALNEKIGFKDIDVYYINDTIYNYLDFNNKIYRSKDINKIEFFKKNDFKEGIKAIYGESNALKYIFYDVIIIAGNKYNYNTSEDTYILMGEKQPCQKNYKSNYFLYNIESSDDRIVLRYALYYNVNDNGLLYATPNLSIEKYCLLEDIEKNLNVFKKYEFNIEKINNKFQLESIKTIN